MQERKILLFLGYYSLKRHKIYDKNKKTVNNFKITVDFAKKILYNL